MVFKWSILHCSWEQISYNCLENNLNGSQVRKVWSWHQKLQNTPKCREIDLWEGQNHVLCYLIRNIGFRWPMLHQSWVHSCCNGLENNLNDYHVNKAWLWHQEVAKYPKCREIDIWGEGSKSCVMLFYHEYGT